MGTLTFAKAPASVYQNPWLGWPHRQDMDVRIKPWLNWRTQVDYNYLRFVGVDFNGVRVGTGLAFRFGRQ
jgi:hypothetical protein